MNLYGYECFEKNEHINGVEKMRAGIIMGEAVTEALSQEVTLALSLQ